ncbi:MAG: hypothetical protein K6E97_05130 [Treponema sp.]|nr:hypothetical protein [Treponema sp.]
MSLLCKNYQTKREITTEHEFYELFYNNIHIKNHPDKDIFLPATKLADWCYTSMFSGCSSLTQAPQLPATNLEESCYSFMFRNCYSLTKAPVLPAKTLTQNCYENMFDYCSSLNEVTCLATNISAGDCTTNWLGEVASSGTFKKASGINWPRGADGIPGNWNIIQLDYN